MLCVSIGMNPRPLAIAHYRFSSYVRCCYFSALVLTCYRLKKGHATFYRPKTIVTSLLLLMVLSFKEIFNHIYNEYLKLTIKYQNNNIIVNTNSIISTAYILLNI